MSQVQVPEEMPVPFSAVAAGHAANGGNPILACSASDDIEGSAARLLKPFDEAEFRAYSSLAGDYKEDTIHAYLPSFHGVCQFGGSEFLSIGNLLEGFTNPKVMDVKIGTRTFLEAEAQNTKLRQDLFAKMVAQYPAEVCSHEHEAKAVTKHRWMDVHDRKSTTRSLGYRIGGVAGYNKKDTSEANDQFKLIHTESHTCEAFHGFVKEVATEAPMNAGRIARALMDRLCQLRSALELSKFFASHECIGTSILLVADASGRTGAFWIDFAKTQPLNEGISITHREVWKAGSHEDGVLHGMDHMITAWSCVTQMFHGVKAAQFGTTAPIAGPSCPENSVSSRERTINARSASGYGPRCSRSKSIHHHSAASMGGTARRNRRSSTIASIGSTRLLAA